MSIAKTYLAHSIEKTAEEAQYDANAKALIADKQVLARIAKYRTEEFKDYDIAGHLTIIDRYIGKIYDYKPYMDIIEDTLKTIIYDGKVYFRQTRDIVAKAVKRI